MNILQKSSVFVASMALSACGGGGGNGDAAGAAPSAPAAPPPAEVQQVPDEASASALALVGWLKKLSGGNEAAEGTEPMAVTNFKPPQPDDSEPEPAS